MKPDRVSASPDNEAETAEIAGQAHRTAPRDRPGAEGAPSRADSRTGAADANGEDERSRVISGDGPSDDNARTVGLEETLAERGSLDRLKKATSKTDSDDGLEEISATVDRPDFQDPQSDPRLVPDRYAMPLDRPDGTRTPLFDGEPTREQTQQGRLGDCGIIATLGAVAGHRPEAIRDCVRETEDGDYGVRFHETRYSSERSRFEPTGRFVNLTVSPELPIFDGQSERPAFADSAQQELPGPRYSKKRSQAAIGRGATSAERNGTSAGKRRVTAERLPADTCA